MIYLASPYNHPDPQVRQHRFEQACDATLALMAKGHIVYSPIVHNHPLALRGQLPTGWEFWHAYDTEMLRLSKALWVLTIDGWKESVGVQAEIKIAEQMDLEIIFLRS